MKTVKLLKLTMITAFFTACGGGGGSTAPATTPNTTTNTQTEGVTLQLTVGNLTLDSQSSLPRVTSTINAEKNVTKVSINKEGTISISGGDDSHLFELLDMSEGKQLAFKTTPDASNPTDTNNDGVYEVDIAASDNDGQSITYQAAYKIAKPITISSLLSGNTYYVDLGDNQYNEISFNDDTIANKRYQDTVFISGSAATLPITYTTDTFEFTDEEGINTVCTIKDSSIPAFTCTENGGEAFDVTFLSTAPEFVAPESYKVSAVDEDINNHTEISVPTISSFTVTGNSPSENGKAIISKSKLNGKFSYEVSLENFAFAQLLNSGLSDADFLITEKGNGIDQIEPFNCQFVKDNGENTGIEYTCDGISIENTTGNADTTLYIYVCDDQNTSSSDTQCSSASVPVLFTE
jgi:hypothetical protein